MCYSCRSNPNCPSCPNNRNSRTLRFVYLFRTQHAASLPCYRLLTVLNSSNLLQFGNVGTLRAASALVIVLGRSTLRPYHVLAYSQFSVFTFPFSVPLINLALRAETCFLQGSTDGLNVLMVAGFHLELQDAVGYTVGVIATFVVHLHHIATQ